MSMLTCAGLALVLANVWMQRATGRQGDGMSILEKEVNKGLARDRYTQVLVHLSGPFPTPFQLARVSGHR
jgi:hypothetical protein